MSPLIREALFWFCIGSGIALFVFAAILAFAVFSFGVGGVGAMSRAMAKGVDAVIAQVKRIETAEEEETRVLPPRSIRP